MSEIGPAAALGASPYGVDYEYFAIEFAGDRLVRHALTRG
jgi:hypothetical protein